MGPGTSVVIHSGGNDSTIPSPAQLVGDSLFVVQTLEQVDISKLGDNHGHITMTSKDDLLYYHILTSSFDIIYSKNDKPDA